jgi:hypothetical protein
MRDLMNAIAPKRGLSPVASGVDNTPLVSQIIDMQGYDSLTWLIATGAIPDADATFAVTMDEGEQANLSDAAAVAAADLIGTLALAGFIFSDDDKVFKVGYKGAKRYVRLTITPSLNTGATLLCAIALRGHPAAVPTANPPA